jgi:biotin synthase-related radical SAM superfamily protein
MRFLGFSYHEKGAPRQEISKCSTVCSTFSRSGWSVVRSALLTKGCTPKNRPSPHFHKVQTRNSKVKVKLSLCFHLTEHHAMKAYWGSGGTDPHILYLSYRWR